MNIIDFVLSFIFLFIVLAIAMSVHEFAHAWVANRLGDSTAKRSGRLTLNPLAHIDVFWTLILPFVLFMTTNGRFIFGAAKPVPISYWNLNNPKRDIVWVGVAGPLANFLLALLLSILLKFTHNFAVILFLEKLIVINVVLAVFNLLPIPPLDGSRILIGLLPKSVAGIYYRLEPYSFAIVALLLFTGVLGSVIWPVVSYILRMLGVVF